MNHFDDRPYCIVRTCNQNIGVHTSAIYLSRLTIVVMFQTLIYGCIIKDLIATDT